MPSTGAERDTHGAGGDPLRRPHIRDRDATQEARKFGAYCMRQSAGEDPHGYATLANFSLQSQDTFFTSSIRPGYFGGS